MRRPPGQNRLAQLLMLSKEADARGLDLLDAASSSTAISSSRSASPVPGAGVACPFSAPTDLDNVALEEFAMAEPSDPVPWRHAPALSDSWDDGGYSGDDASLTEAPRGLAAEALYAAGLDGVAASIKAPKTRRVVSEDGRAVLERWLIAHRANPYPTEHEKKVLAVKTGTTVDYVRCVGAMDARSYAGYIPPCRCIFSTWFTNARARRLLNKAPSQLARQKAPRTAAGDGSDLGSFGGSGAGRRTWQQSDDDSSYIE